MSNKLYNCVYKITNLKNGKIYIGRHSTNNLNDKYMGSGNEILADLKLYGRKNFVKEILYIFDSWQEMVDKETELLTEEFLNRPDTYNLSSGGSGIVTHTEEVRRKLSEINRGLVSVVDEYGNCYRVSIDDPRYLNGELKHNCVGMVVVKDIDGNIYRVSKDDPKYISGELVSINVGMKHSIEKSKHHSDVMTEWWKTNSHSDVALKKMRDANLGMVTVKDKFGNLFRVPVDDNRIKNGELVYIWTGRKQSKEQIQKISESKKGYIWICNLNSNQTKMIKPEDALFYLDNGWIRGRTCK